MSAGGHLQARGLRVHLGGRAILDGIDLEIPRGALVALVGPSGAGKSTLLRALVRLVEVTGGSVSLDGVDVDRLDPPVLRRRVSFVAQAPVMLPTTVADNLRHGVEGLSADDLGAALADAGLDSTFADRVAARLSGGEQARVALARALARRPEVLLLDEPTAALDGRAAEHVGATLRRLCDERALGICLTTHDHAFAGRWCDRSVALP